MTLNFTDKAWEDYRRWQEIDKKTLKKVNKLLEDINRNGYSGIGKPEPLKNDKRGYWSRRIDQANRITYKMNGEEAVITSCAGHYE